MDWRIELLFALLASTLYVSHGCSMDGINTWLVPHTTEVIDIQRGIFFERNTTNIQAISSTQHSEELSGGPYVSASLQDDVFTIFTNDAFAQYEENEVATSIGVTFVFTCAQGSPQNSVTFVVQINVIDTNNNAPQFLPSNAYELTVTPPLPPGYLITGCLTDIIVRDIDLTTRRIEFAIEDNPYFEIEFDEVNTIAQSKEFKAILRTTLLVRNIPEPLQLVISATDVDDTRDPPLTTNATVRIQSDGEFELPEEPVFSQAFYLAEYSNNQIIQQETISLQQGYHDEVVFDLEGELAANFEISRNGSELTLVVTSPLSADTLSAGQLYMAVKAQREYTSGASATIIIQLPQVVGLEFEQANYEGTIVDNALTPLQLVLSQGYEDGVTIAISSEFASYFTYTAQNNAIILNMSPLESTIIDQNNFINLLIIASNDQSTATTIVTLDIIKDDNTTPAFEQSAYTGSYDTVTGLYMEQNVTLAQGYDGTVGFYLDGEHSSFFELDNDGPVVSLRSSTLPTEILSEGSLLLTVLATKPRTVGANTAVSITLPAARNLIFDSPVYSGTIQDNVITMDTIILGVGYGDDVEFTLSGDYADYFEIPNTGNEVTLSLSQDTELPADVILSNKYIPLIVSATGQHALETSTTIILDILKDDTSTPVFRQNIYTGTYTGSNIDLEAIDLLQGYDGSVTFRLDGLHSQYFGMNINGNGVEIAVTSTIPTELIMEQKVLSFSVLADKPLTVGAHATVIVRFPPELSEPAVLRFSQNSYVGSLENNLLELGNITLETGYSNGTLFSITGEYSDNFEISENGNILTLQLTNPIPNDFIEANSFLLLDIEASYPGAISGYTTIVLDIVNEPQVLTPVFAEAYYIGEYSEQEGLLFDQSIELIEGFDDSVTFGLDGDDAQLFQLVTNGPNNMSITANNIIADTEDRTPFILSIIANKPNSLGGKATIIISRSDLRATRLLSFSQNFYAGRIEDGELTSETIILSEGYTPELNYALSGEYADHFQLTRDNASFELALQSELPTETVSSYNVLVLTLEVGVHNSVVHTSIVIELIKNEPSVLSFDETFYIGSYSEAEGLVSPTITLIEGFDENVSFFLHEESAQWFDMDIDSNTVSLVLRDSVPPASLLSIQPHVFSITAEKPGSATTATIVISVEQDSDVNVLLSFERNSYLGYIENDVLSLDPITLIEGYNANVSFSLQGDLSSYFTYTNQGSTVTVSLQNAIPEESIPTSGIIVLELQASAPQTASAYATIVFEVVRESATAVNVVFSETYYTGQYTDSGGLVFENLISLAEGYDDSVQFTLEGENAQWFEIDRTDNEVSLVVATPIPPAIPMNNHQLIFTIVAQIPESDAGARATIIIFLTGEYDSELALGFERISYLGSIENNVSTLDPITLIEGYTTDVSFTLHGDLSSYFTYTNQGSTVTVSLQNAIPEESIPTSGIIVLELQASAPQAASAYATIVFEVVRESATAVNVVFSETYYTGQYTDSGGLVFENLISLTEGYDDSVQFTLEGDSAQWFEIDRTDNEVSLVVATPIPPAIPMNNHQLIFTIVARIPESDAGARATIIIFLTGEYDSELALGFERISYLGSIENNVSTLDPITLIEGYTTDVSFTLHGDLSSYFTYTNQGSTVTVSLQNAIPEESIPTSGIIVLELQASAPQTASAYATIVFEVVRESATAVNVVFSETYYTGQYTDSGGLVFENLISLTEGYDDSVQFTLEGESAQWFEIDRTDNEVSLVVATPIPPAIPMNNHQLIFTIVARIPENDAGARATIIIFLTGEYNSELALGFERISYLGSIENNVSTLDPITLIEGYTTDVSFTLHGDLSSYFTYTNQGSTVTVSLQNAIPEESIPTSGIIVLELQASAPQTASAYATIVFEVVRESATAVNVVFSETYYTGQYTDSGGLVFENLISLAEGYDDSVQFTLEGENAQWFEIDRTDNEVSLVVATPIPPAIPMNNHQLIFTIVAQIPESDAGARATIIIFLTGEYDSELALGFERISYLGSIENNVSTLDPITLIEGYTTDVSFTLHGDLSSYFTYTNQGSTVTVSLQNAIPEESIPTSGIIVLELQASAPQTASAYATIVFEVVRESATAVNVVFSETYYTGQYTDSGGLVFENLISLTEGYDDSVQFTLEGESAQWFEIDRTDNEVSLVVATPIPPAIPMNNHQLIFTIVARIPENDAGARATIIIFLTGEYDSELALGFERISYLGSIENNVSTLDPITLIEGYTTDVSFTLHGDLSSYFTYTNQGSTVTVSLQNAIPEESIPTSGIIVLELQASAPQTASAYATIVFEVVRESATAVNVVFSETYYTGQYTDSGGLVFKNLISLTEGYDDSVQFTLEGESAQWFEIDRTDNEVSLVVATPIPPAIPMNNHQLIFTIVARIPENDAGARATIIIFLTGEYDSELALGFERISYLGSIENNVSTLDPITLIEGYTTDVSFTLHGDLSSYFTYTNQGSTVTVSLQNAIPEESIPTSGIIVLELQASAPQTASAYATIVFEVVRESATAVNVVFSETYYTGQYTGSGGLVFENLISLTEGYDDSVQFTLEGDSAQWFEIDRTDNEVSLVVATPIPPAIPMNNHQLIFTIVARIPESDAGARATIIIFLTGEYDSELALGFERISYLGSIENNVSTLDPITLIEGYTTDVSFTLHGDLSSYFTYTNQGSTVTVSLQNAIPEESIPTSGIIVLELQASAPQAASAYATIVFEVVRESATAVNVVFSETYYTGQYTDTGGLFFENLISLAEGYDDSVQFTLEGESAQWFEIDRTDNEVSLVVATPIPPAIPMNNHQLIFTIVARIPESDAGARATIIIFLTGEYDSELALGFERISYLGSIENNVSTLDPITLIEGYTTDVSFTLHGDLSSYFTYTNQGSTVTVSLQNAIPEESIPTSGIIVLELQASAPQTASAYATIVFEVVRESATAVNVVFSETYYTGQYTDSGGLVFENLISLTEGYDDSVQFTLEGESAQWFEIDRTDNEVSLVVATPIPPAIPMNNHQLIFTIVARIPENDAGARATIIIFLTGEYDSELALGFERISYLGSIENNVSTLDPITLIEGYTTDVSFTLHGDLSSYFTYTNQGSTVTVSLQNAIPEESIPTSGIIVLELQASAPQTASAYATIVFEVVRESATAVNVVFSETYYTGQYTDSGGLVFENLISLTEGYDDSVQFTLEGDSAQWFEIDRTDNEVSLVVATPIPPAIPMNNHQLIFTIVARIPESDAGARATIIIFLTGEYDSELALGFERISYLGSIENNVSTLDPITLIEGYTTDVSFTLHGDLSSYFTYTNQGSTVTVSLQNAIPEESIPTSGIIVLELQASAPQTASAYATIVFEVVRESATAVNVVFSETYYTGQYTDSGGLVFENLISLAEGYDESVQFTLEGESAQWFEIDRTDNEVSLVVATPIPPEVPTNYHQLIFTIAAQRPPSAAGASATIIIFLRDDETVPVVVFDKVLYEGIIQSGSVHHEAITVSGFTGTTVEVLGAYGELFEASHSDGVVVVNGVGSLNLGDNTTFVPLELRAGGAGSVLILDVMQTESSEPPSVVFSSASYSLQVDTSHTGLLGRVEATASNGESVSYSLQIDNEHLLQRLFINNEGEIHLSAPAQATEYSFQVTASTVFTQASGAASVQLTVDGEATCTDDSLAVDPLIVLDRDEEEPHRNLIVLREEFGGCRYSISSSWPEDQSWLYVDDTGLHTNAIDREDQSIAFMALSQVKVELLLHCDTDTRRNKRSVDTRLEWLGPYDYGNNTWVIANTIEYNPRRTVVNLIVNDINDNYPIFVGKENEPITVGYPISELEEIVLPRVLIELRATDADVGENAALRYWSPDDVIAVSPSSGLVHVRHNQRLENNAIITVHATDRNGEGLTGSLDLLVKLLDVSHIAVVTVKNAFLDDEQTILDNLSAAVGYEINVLRSTVISDNEDSNQARRKRNTADTEGASMQMYVYGLIENEPVEVDRVTTDINNLAVATVVVASSVSLEDHLNALEICNTTGLLVATIVLSVLLFILIVVAVVWFFLKWWKNRKYDQFSDANSLASQNETSQQPKPQPGPQPFPPHKPRLNIEELRRSERRLQEMLDAPIEEVSVEPSTSREAPAESVIDIPQPSLQIPIVIQSIDKLKDAADESDDEDEFGERLKTRRKSVVTFNENVEKIIHVEDPPEEGSLPDYEVYKL